MSQSDVLIVGGGIIGAACARSLELRDVTVTVIEAGPKPGAATPAAAGMLAPFFEISPDDPLLSLTVRARDLYADLAPALQDETGIDICLWMEGIVHVAFTEEEVTRAKGDVAWQRQSGFPAHWLPADDLRERLPGVAPDALGGALAPEDGALEPRALHEALLESAETKGARIVRGESVEEIVIEGERTTAVRTASELHRAGAVLIAAGCWSGPLAGLPRPLSVVPIRGQMAALVWPEGEPRAVVYGSGGYVLERAGEAVAGTTMEHAGFEPSVTDEGLNQIFRATRRIYPALDGAEVVRTWAGLRPGTPDGRPILGPDPTVPNLWYATGHGRNGVLLAGLSGELLAQLYVGDSVAFDLSPMAPGRFWQS